MIASRFCCATLLRSYAGGLVETADFQKIVNKHMSARVGSGGQPEARLVFDQWVYETGIPTYRLDSSLAATKGGGFVLKGRIKQDNVSEYFMMPVEVFGHFGPNKVVRIGRVVAAGKETDFRLNLKTKPQKSYAGRKPSDSLSQRDLVRERPRRGSRLV